MIAGTGTLNQLLQENVLEVRFTRRRPSPDKGPTRRMLCTLCPEILNSVNGRTVLNYLPPTKPLKFNPTAKNLVMVWDILMQDFRLINGDSCDLLTTIPGDEKFWEYFNSTILPMSSDEKAGFMNT